MKREVKNNVNDKRRTGKRRTGTGNFRSLNNFQIYDKVPNDKLYKND